MTGNGRRCSMRSAPIPLISAVSTYGAAARHSGGAVATVEGVERAIDGFHCDELGDWVAHLECGHRQHVRHRPPFQMRPWVETAAGRRDRIGTPLDCPLCDRAELPDGLRYVRSTDVWDDSSLPAGLRRDHRLGPGTWGVLHVLSGRLRFVPDGDTWSQPPAAMDAGASQPIPPQMTHHVETAGPVSVRIDFYKVPDKGPDPGGDPEGGESACYAHLVCPDCGALVDRPDAHRPGCPAARWA